MEKHPVQELADAVGGTITDGGILPDGSGFAIMSMALPKDHWIYEREAVGFRSPPPMPFRMGCDDPRRHDFNKMVRAAARYAIKASTMGGEAMDFDPDAMVQNFVVGMLGYHTNDGLSGENFGNPNPVPDLYPGAEHHIKTSGIPHKD